MCCVESEKDKITIILLEEFCIKAEITWAVISSPSPLPFYDGKRNVIEEKR